MNISKEIYENNFDENKIANITNSNLTYSGSISMWGVVEWLKRLLKQLLTILIMMNREKKYEAVYWSN